jgi:hypothetical protein
MELTKEQKDLIIKALTNQFMRINKHVKSGNKDTQLGKNEMRKISEIIKQLN